MVSEQVVVKMRRIPKTIPFSIHKHDTLTYTMHKLHPLELVGSEDVLPLLERRSLGLVGLDFEGLQQRHH